MRLLVLSRYDQLGASSRLRFFQFLPYLTSRGFEVTVAPLLGDDYVASLYHGKISILGVMHSYVESQLFCLYDAQLIAQYFVTDNRGNVWEFLYATW